jgi:hypothetical protein
MSGLHLEFDVLNMAHKIVEVRLDPLDLGAEACLKAG